MLGGHFVPVKLEMHDRQLALTLTLAKITAHLVLRPPRMRPRWPFLVLRPQRMRPQRPRLPKLRLGLRMTEHRFTCQTVRLRPR